MIYILKKDAEVPIFRGSLFNSMSCSLVAPADMLKKLKGSDNVCYGQVFSAAMEEMRVSWIMDPPNILLVSGRQLEHP